MFILFAIYSTIFSYQRQIIHDSSSIKQYKAESAVAKLSAINPTLSFSAIVEKLDADNALRIFRDFELVLDCTDNFDARYIINDACVLLKIPYISGSAVGLEGQITVIVPGETPCYRCLYPKPSVAEACRSCANAGVLGPVPGLIGCLEATEAIKIILTGLHRPGIESSSASRNLSVIKGRQVFYDARQGEFFSFDLPPRNAVCEVCGDVPSITSMTQTKQFLDAFQSTTECAVAGYVGTIPDNHQLSVRAFQKLLDTQLVAPQSFLILDVRSAVQFQITHLNSPTIQRVLSDWPSLREYVSKRDTEPASKSENILVNIPLSDLEKNLESILETITTLKTHTAATSKEPLQTILLCRRGIDSTVATRLFLRHGHAQDVFNISGGLVAWQEQVDQSFPMY